MGIPDHLTCLLRNVYAGQEAAPESYMEQPSGSKLEKGYNKAIVNVKSLSCVQLFATPWTVDYQGPLSMGFFRQEYWSGLPFLSPGDLPNPGIKFGSPTLWADALPSKPPEKAVVTLLT